MAAKTSESDTQGGRKEKGRERKPPEHETRRKARQRKKEGTGADGEKPTRNSGKSTVKHQVGLFCGSVAAEAAHAGSK